MPKRDGWSRIQVMLHWTTVVLLVVQYFLGQLMEEAYEARLRGEAAEGGDLFGSGAHVVVGVAILAAMITRFVLRFTQGIARTPENEPKWAALLGSLTHYAFYVVLLLMAITGVSAFFLGIAPAGEVHATLFWVLFAVIVLHVGGALVEQFVLKTGVLSRMLRPGADGRGRV